MKVISVRQPWAHLIAIGVKDVENRSRRTNYRGPILIHAALALAKTPIDEIEQRYGVSIDRAALHRGGVIGACSIVDCVDEHRSQWFDGEGFGYVLANARTLPFWPMRGRLGIFQAPAE